MNIVNLINGAARNYPQRVALSGEGEEYTFKEMSEHYHRIANQCLSLDLSYSTRFAALTPNCTQAMLVMLGAKEAGGVWCNLNIRNALADNIDILSRGGCQVLFFHSSVSNCVDEIRAGVDTLTHCICLDKPDPRGEYLMDWIKNASAKNPELPLTDEQISLQSGTGGTTGQPKLVLATSRWIVHTAYGLANTLLYDEPPVNLVVTPISHAAGVICCAHLAYGGKNIIMAAADLEEILINIEKHKVTTLFLPPTVIYMLLKHPKVRDYDYSSLKYLLSVAAPLAASKIAEAVDVFGPVVCQTFGQTESGVPLTFISPKEIMQALQDKTKRHRLESCGRQTMIVQAMEIMDDDGNILKNGEKGELVLRAPSVMKEYLNDPAATQEVQQYGWHHTGDIAYRDDDGFIYICDRKRDLIVSGGFNIFPFEIEQVLLTMKEVQECAVIGVPDEKWGEAVKAVIELSPGATLDEASIIAQCKERLGGMKTPKSVDAWDTLPRSPVGKVLKREVRRHFWHDKNRNVN